MREKSTEMEDDFMIKEGFSGKMKMKEGDRMLMKRSQAYLSREQVERLMDVMNDEIDVHGRGNFPTLRLTLSALIKRVLCRLSDRCMGVKQVKMNGGAASYILASRDLPYTDIDLIFGGVDLSEPKKFDAIKDAVLEALIDFLPACTNKSKITPSAMKEAYVKKMVKVCSEDMWSLISLNNDLGRFIELKFVHRMRRQFEFSVDSFQIHLDSVLFASDGQRRGHDDQSMDKKGQNVTSIDTQKQNVVSMEKRQQNVISSQHTVIESPHSVIESPANVSKPPVTLVEPHPHLDHSSTPIVMAESVYGDFQAALRHLNKMLIDTTEPELIRGGGLLKYCQLLARGYRPARVGMCRHLEPYMCSRFFIDFPTVLDQQKKLRAYMDNHFGGNTGAKHDYLLLLYRVVDESTVCLMNHDRRLTLSMIDSMAYELSARMYYEEQRRRAIMAAKALSVQAGTHSDTLSTSPSVNGGNDRRVSLEDGTSSSCSGGNNEQNETSSATGEGSQQQRPKQTLLYVPPNASYWIKVV